MKKTKLIFNILIALSLLAVLLFSGCSEPDPEYTVKYEITGPESESSALIRFTNETGKQEELLSDNLPWSKTITVTGKKIQLKCEVVPDYKNDNNKKYTVNIYVDNSLKATKTGSSFISASYLIN
jgi:hypothetical protein